MSVEVGQRTVAPRDVHDENTDEKIAAPAIRAKSGTSSGTAEVIASKENAAVQLASTAHIQMAGPLGVLSGYRLFLGREPESERVVKEKATLPLQRMAASFVASQEFSDRVLAPLASNYPLPHFSVSAFPTPELTAWAAETLPLAPETRARLTGARTWRELLMRIVADEDFRARLEQPLRPDHVASVRRRLAATPSAGLEREIVGWIDQTSMFELRGWARNLLNLDERLTLEVFLDNLFIGVAETAQFRRDVQEQLGGSGYAGFCFYVPAAHHADLESERLLTVRDSISQMPIVMPIRIRLGQADTLDSLLRLRAEVDELVDNMERLKSTLPGVLADTEHPVSMYAAYQREARKQLMARRGAQIVETAGWAYSPAISVVVYGPGDTAQITHSINSLRRQTYRHWECVLCAPLEQEEVRALADTLCAADTRMKAAGGYNAAEPWTALNSSVKEAEGEYVVWLRQGDLLSEDALYELGRALQEKKFPFITFDEDLFVRENGKARYVSPVLKTAFDRDHLLAHDYIGNAFACSRSLIEEAGGFDGDARASHTYDLLLRLSERLKPDEMLHLERILYHRQESALEKSLGEGGTDGDDAIAVVNAHLQRIGAPAAAEAHEDSLGTARPEFRRIVWRLPEPAPSVSIVVPTRDRADLMGPCLESVFASQQHYSGRIDIVVMDNESCEAETEALFERVKRDRNVRIIPYNREFNWSAINNLAARRAKSDILIFLNNDTQVLTPDWVRELVSHASRPEVGAVGARLLYEDGTIQHGGVVLGGRAVHEALGDRPGEGGGYLARTALQRNVSAVTGACLATRRSLFLELGGFDETGLKVAFNDVDYCLKVRAAGFAVIYTPFATLYHFESKSRGLDEAFDKRLRSRNEMDFLRSRWGERMDRDPFYNSRFTRLGRPFSRLRPPQLVAEAKRFPEEEDELWENE